MSVVFNRLDEVIQRLARIRDGLLGDGTASDRAARLASMFAAEAEAWSQVYELAHLRLIWRAALAAEAGARANAALWARRTVSERTGRALVPICAAGRVGAPRRAALSTAASRG